MIDRKAFRSLSSGLYLITAKAGDMRCGCVVNTLVQVASEPATLSVSLNKENATTDVILDSGRFTVSCLAQDATMELMVLQMAFSIASSLEAQEAFSSS